MQWFTISWWKYLFGPRYSYIGMISTAICRAKGHSCGVWFYNMNGDEPNMTCKNCGDDLG